MSYFVRMILQVMPVFANLSSMNSQTTKKVTVALGVAALASSAGSVAVQAGPALQTLTNLTNTAGLTINNTYGQSFSVNGIVTGTVTPFASTASIVGNPTIADFTAGTATLTTGFVGGNQVGGFIPVTSVSASVQAITNTVPIRLSAAAMTGIVLNAAGTASVTIGASISSTLFGPSTVTASSSYTNQIINDLSAF